MISKKQGIIEGLIVFSVMTGILLPVRLLFVTYVSNNWFGSFGLISLVSIAIIILTKKQKLGAFGKMFERQLGKLQHGKRAKWAYGQSIFFLLVLGGTIFAIEAGNSYYIEIKDQLNEQFSEFSDKSLLLEKSKEIKPQEWIYGIIGLILAIFFAFPQLAAVLSILNDTFDGWILHFYTVGFVEYLELFAILLIHRFTFDHKSTKSDLQTK